MSGGPLAGLRVVELAGLGPCPFAAMLLADLGAEVIRVDRAADVGRAGAGPDLLGRNRDSIALDLKQPEGVAVLLDLVADADVLLEGHRPGVAERLGFGPEVCWQRNPGLVYGRATGWGQEGPLAHTAGHDINYIALTGALAAIGRHGEPPTPPLALVGDFAGGGMMLAFGVLAARHEARSSGRGQVVDAAVVDGVAVMMSYFYGRHAQGAWSLERGTNAADSGSHFYNAYECSDGKYLSVGSVEPKFYARLLVALDVGELDPADQRDPATWPHAKATLARVFRTRPRDEWERLLAEHDLCSAPVLTMEEAPRHPHHRARRTFVEVDGVVQGAPAPRFSRTPGSIRRPAPRPGEDTDTVLAGRGYDEARLARLREMGAIR